MNEKLGIIHMWIEGGPVIQFTALVLLLMSIISWVVLIYKVLMVNRLKKQSQVAKKFWQSASFKDGVKGLDEQSQSSIKIFKNLVDVGQSTIVNHRDMEKQFDQNYGLGDLISERLQNSIDEAEEKLDSGLAVLASIGSTAPFVGLFGTVWGIYHALLSIGEMGQVSIDKVAGPVGEALIMTAFGLGVAIPAVLGYNALVRGNKRILRRLNRFAQDLHSYYLIGHQFKNS